jgi:hypothetical protein
MDEYLTLVEWYWQAKTNVLGENPVAVSFYSPQTPYEMT